MKILLITHKFPPSVGGMEKHCFELASGLAKNHDCIIHAFQSDKQSRFNFFFNLKHDVRRILASHDDIDLIYLNDGLMVAFSLWLRKLTQIPVVASFHGLDVVFPLSIYQKYIIPKFNYLSKMIAVSHFTQEALVARRLDHQRICVISNGVDTDLKIREIDEIEKAKLGKEFFDRLSGKKILLMVGRPVRRKGMSWFVKNVLPRLDQSFHLMIAGSFDKEPSRFEKLLFALPRFIGSYVNLFFGFADDKLIIKKVIQENSIANRVSLLPRLSDKALSFIYEQADAFIMPNIKVKGDAEGFGLVALEASIRGLPVFCSDIEGIRDAIQNGDNGYHVPSQNGDAWISKIQEKFSDLDQLKADATSFKRFTKSNYGWHKMNASYEKTFLEVVEANR